MADQTTDPNLDALLALGSDEAHRLVREVRRHADREKIAALPDMVERLELAQAWIQELAEALKSEALGENPLSEVRRQVRRAATNMALAVNAMKIARETSGLEEYPGGYKALLQEAGRIIEESI